MKNELTPLYKQKTGHRMRVAGFMSGSGSNLVKILEHERITLGGTEKSPFEVAVIFSDDSESNAIQIGKDFDLPVITRDIDAFYRKRQKPRWSMDTRRVFDSHTQYALDGFNIEVLAFAGYMSIVTEELLNNYLVVNVHPADLTLMEGEIRKFTGDTAVADAIKAGETHLRSTTHIVEGGVDKVDYGRILMVSSPLRVELPMGYDRDKQIEGVANEYQNRLKEKGDWVIFPKTLEDLARGRYSHNAEGLIHYDGEPKPAGVRL